MSYMTTNLVFSGLGGKAYSVTEIRCFQNRQCSLVPWEFRDSYKQISDAG